MHIIWIFCLFPLFLFSEGPFLLKNNLEKAKKGDYLVIAQGKCYTLFHVYDISPPLLTIEEIAIPSQLASQAVSLWSEWVEKGAPFHTSWVHYQIDLEKNEIKNYFSFTKNSRFIVPDADNFLGVLLKLPFKEIPESQRKKVGRALIGGACALWQPQMVVSGKIIPGVLFSAYESNWPNDGGPLSGKSIEIYLPKEDGVYPGYFPYWLQVKGVMGPAKVRIVDSGHLLRSPVINNLQ